MRIISCLSILFLYPAYIYAQISTPNIEYQPIAYVNDIAVTPLDLEKNIKMAYFVNNVPHDTKIKAQEKIQIMKVITNNILKSQELERYNVEPNIQRVQSHIQKMVSSRRISMQGFEKLMGLYGVTMSQLEKNISLQLGWQDYIRGRYGSDITISSHEIAQIVENIIKTGGIGVDFDEIFLPVKTISEAEKQQKKSFDIIKKIHDGESFTELMTSYNLQNEKKGIRPLASIDTALHSFLISAKKSEISSAIQSQNGFHILRLNNREANKSLSLYPKVSSKTGLFKKEGKTNKELKEELDLILSKREPCQNFHEYFEDISEYKKLKWNEYPENIQKYIRTMTDKESKIINLNDDHIEILTVCGIDKIDYYHDAPPDLQQSVKNQVKNKKIALKEQEHLRKLRNSAVIILVD